VLIVAVTFRSHSSRSSCSFQSAVAALSRQYAVVLLHRCYSHQNKTIALWGLCEGLLSLGLGGVGIVGFFCWLECGYVCRELCSAGVVCMCVSRLLRQTRYVLGSD
jgi:hypothetical protein